MKKEKVILYVSSALILIGAYFVFKQYKSDNNKLNSSNNEDLNYDLLLKKGSTGNEVAVLQKKLGNLDDDGIFGDLTEKRLIELYKVKQIRLSDLM